MHGEQPSAEIFLARESGLGDLDLVFREYGDPIPGLLSVNGRSIPHLFENVVRELLLGHLQLLQSDEIGFSIGEPEPDEIEPSS